MKLNLKFEVTTMHQKRIVDLMSSLAFASQRTLFIRPTGFDKEAVLLGHNMADEYGRAGDATTGYTWIAGHGIRAVKIHVTYDKAASCCHLAYEDVMSRVKPVVEVDTNQCKPVVPTAPVQPVLTQVDKKPIHSIGQSSIKVPKNKRTSKARARATSLEEALGFSGDSNLR